MEKYGTNGPQIAIIMLIIRAIILNDYHNVSATTTGRRHQVAIRNQYKTLFSIILNSDSYCDAANDDYYAIVRFTSHNGNH